MLVLVGLVALLGARLRRRGARTAREAGTDGRREWSCRCGERYLVSGSDRHRVYWAAGAATEDPILGQECLRCGARLPADREATAA